MRLIIESFPCYGAGVPKGRSMTPVGRSLEHAPPQFALGVKVGDVVDAVLMALQQPQTDLKPLRAPGGGLGPYRRVRKRPGGSHGR